MNLSGSWQYIQMTARSRLEHNKTSRHVSEYGEGIEVLGAAGEIVARRFLGVAEVLHDGFDGGCDILFHEMRIDVKATVLTPKVHYRFLQWPLNKHVRSDIILMTAVDPIHMMGTLLGYATREEVLRAPVNYQRKYPCAEIPVNNLHPVHLLLMEALSRMDITYRRSW